MIIFNEGVPRAGKSYDAMLTHVLPALEKGRHVWYRLNGVTAAACAEYLGKPVEEIEPLMHDVKSADVVETFKAERDANEEFVLPERFRNALIVIDEVHEFYVSGREALPKDVEQFFAIHGHYGSDILLMTQWYKRMHTAIRARVERKNVFQKLTAVGMKGHYRVTFWQTVSPDKYEKVGAATKKYDPKVFPTYKGYAADEVDTTVYDGGSRTVWASVGPLMILAVALFVGGGYYLWNFFSGGVDITGRGGEDAASAPVKDSTAGGVWQQDTAQVRSTGPSAPPSKPPPPPDPVDKMTAEQQYVWRMAKGARARVSAMIGAGDDMHGIIEFRKENQPPMDVMDTRHLIAMGIEVETKPYGFILRANGESIVATMWPTNEPVRPNNHELYRLDRPGAAGESDMHASNASVISLPSGSPASRSSTDDLRPVYGGFRDRP